MSSNVAATVEKLREQIEKLKAAPRKYLAALRTQVAPFDALFPGRGVPLGTAVELHGEAASGRTSLALRAVAAAHREQKLCAWVDGPRELYPPAAAAMGVDLDRLLIVRPKAPSQLAWAAAQLCRSGAFACVVLDLTHTGLRLSLADAKKLYDAAFRSGSLLLLLTPPDAPADGVLRIAVRPHGIEGFELEVVRSRHGGAGAKAIVGWAELYGEPPFGHRALPATDEPDELRGLPSQPFVRPKLHWERDGVGLSATRPGRDTALPSLEEALLPH